MNDKPRRILITGVSSGIGLGLARECLRQGWTVYGTARQGPDLGKTGRFHFVPCDLSRDREIPSAVRMLLTGVDQLERVVLNAGLLGPFGDLREQTQEEIERVMQVNVWANKAILDTLYKADVRLRQVVTMSSSASVNPSRGWGGYAISKTALNMLTALAALEHPETHFCALAPGLVDTAMQDQLCAQPSDPRYPSLERLRSRRGTSAMPDADEAAPRLLAAMQHLPDLVESGSYADLRRPPLSELQV